MSLPQCGSHSLFMTVFHFVASYCFPAITVVPDAIHLFFMTHVFATGFFLWRRTVSCSLVRITNVCKIFLSVFGEKGRNIPCNERKQQTILPELSWHEYVLELLVWEGKVRKLLLSTHFIAGFNLKSPLTF